MNLEREISKRDYTKEVKKKNIPEFKIFKDHKPAEITNKIILALYRIFHRII